MNSSPRRRASFVRCSASTAAEVSPLAPSPPPRNEPTLFTMENHAGALLSAERKARRCGAWRLWPPLSETSTVRLLATSLLLMPPPLRGAAIAQIPVPDRPVQPQLPARSPTSAAASVSEEGVQVRAPLRCPRSFAAILSARMQQIYACPMDAQDAHCPPMDKAFCACQRDRCQFSSW